MRFFLNKKIVLALKIVALIIVIGLIGLFGILRKKNEPVTLPKTTTQAIAQAVTYDDFHLLIPSLDINAPVIADVDGTNKDAYFKALQGGVAHYKNTSKPGEGSNIFIFGHSSYYIWDPGLYKQIFKNIENIKVGDEINVWNNKKEYKYMVTETKIVEPTETSVLNPTKDEQLTLMTCYPPGTTEKRLIVIAKPI